MKNKQPKKWMNYEDAKALEEFRNKREKELGLHEEVASLMIKTIIEENKDIINKEDINNIGFPERTYKEVMEDRDRIIGILREGNRKPKQDG